MTSVGEESTEAARSSRTFSPPSDNLALVSPSASWQDSLQRLLIPRAPGGAFALNDSDAGSSGTVSPDPRVRRASFPLMSNNVAFPPKMPPISPVISLSSLASFPSENGGVGRVSWDNLEGLEKIDSDSGESDESEMRVPPRLEDVYIDGNGQLRVVNRISGLQILCQCQRMLTGRREEQLECPWVFEEGGSQKGYAIASPLSVFPSEQQQNDLIQSYFEYVHPMFPVLNRACFAAFYSQKLNDPVQGSFRSSGLSAVSLDILLLSMFANASRCRDACGGEQGTSAFVVEAVRLLYSVSGQSHPLLCQALLLLGYHSVGTGFVEAGWTYIGMAVRMAESLGIHRLSDDFVSSGSSLLTKDEQHMRQQIWAGCVIAERYVAVLLGRPSAIRHTDYDIPPVDVSQQRDNEPMFYSVHQGVEPRAVQVSETTALLCFNASLALSSIIGSIMDDLYSISQPSKSVLEQRAKQLEYKLYQWRQSLPGALLFDPSRISALPPPCVLDLQVQYWWSVILLHRAFVHGPLTKDFYAGPEGLQSKALAVCRDSAGQMSSIVAVMHNQPLKFVSAFVPGYLLAVGIVDVLTLSILHHDEVASTRLRSTMSALQRVEATWPMARIVFNLLERSMSNSVSTPIISPMSPTRSKRSAREVFSDDEGLDAAAKKISDQQLPSNHFAKDPGNSYDSLGRMLGLDSGLGFITSQPYPGFQYRSEHLDSPTTVHPYEGAGYGPGNFSAVASPVNSFGLW